jgi:hypothetical protein
MNPPRQAAAFNPVGTDFDRFLYAQVSDDHRGGLLSVISALARVGVDPWEQAGMLARMPVDGAVRALAALLARLPAQSIEPVDPIPLATHLVTLLPHRPDRPGHTDPISWLARIRTVPGGWLLMLLYVVFTLVLLGT